MYYIMENNNTVEELIWKEQSRINCSKWFMSSKFGLSEIHINIIILINLENVDDL